jgi:hypothetical protein
MVYYAFFHSLMSYGLIFFVEIQLIVCIQITEESY